MSETMIAIAVLSVMVSLVQIAKAAWDGVEMLKKIHLTLDRGWCQTPGCRSDATLCRSCAEVVKQ